MAASIEHQDAVVLHSKYFTDSKKIVSLFTQNHGRISAVYRPSKKADVLKPFSFLIVSWSGASNLKTLRVFESVGPPVYLSGTALYCGFYLNELLTRLLPESQPYPTLYQQYAETLNKIAQSDLDRSIQEILLRRFEFSLLNEIGFGLQFLICSDGGGIEDNDLHFYGFNAGKGFSFLQSEHEKMQFQCFSGRQLHDIAHERWSHSSLIAAKRLSRLAFSPLLGNKPIKARELFS